MQLCWPLGGGAVKITCLSQVETPLYCSAAVISVYLVATCHYKALASATPSLRTWIYFHVLSCQGPVPPQCSVFTRAWNTVSPICSQFSIKSVTWLPRSKALEYLFVLRAKLMLWAIRVHVDLALGVELYPLGPLDVNLHSGQIC